MTKCPKCGGDREYADGLGKRLACYFCGLVTHA